MKLRTLLLALALSGALTSAVNAAPAVAKHARHAKAGKHAKGQRAAKRKRSAAKATAHKSVRRAAPHKTAKYKAAKVKKHRA
jgi:hypothetical protein